jgi:FkbM family methyltransferase
MLFKTLLIALLDRPGGRVVLGLLATLYARYSTGADFEITYRHIWVHRVNRYYFPGGHKFNYNRYTIAQSIRFENECCSNSKELWFPFYHPSQGDIIVDVGAGRGEDVPAFLKAIGRVGKLIAIEAHPHSFGELEKFCKLNQFQNVTLLQMAAMDKPGYVTLTDVNNWEANTINQVADANGIEVKAETLDNICTALGVKEISFLKMNIEGAERFALLGMDEMILHCKAVCVACHDFRANKGDDEQFRTRSFVEQYLRERGFKVMSRQLDPRDYVRDHVFGLK